MHRNSLGASGFTLIEVMIAMVISLVSLVGIAGLSIKTVQQESESYQRVQALTLVQDMVDRLNVNRRVASCYANGAAGLTVGTGETYSLSCNIGTAAQNAQVAADLREWDSNLKGAGAQDRSDNRNVGAAIGARGCITEVDATNKIYRITVAWQGLAPTVAPKNACGWGRYGADDSLRRTVNAVVRIGDLST